MRQNHDVQARDHVDSTSTGLLQSAQQMDPAAWRSLVDLYAPLITEWCRHSGVDPTTAADILQNVFLQATVSLPGFEKDGRKAAFRRWLRTLTRSKVADYRRSEGKQPQATGGSTAYQCLREVESRSRSVRLSPQNVSKFRHVCTLMEQVRGGFQPTTWRAFWMTTVEDYTAPEASKVLGISPAAVRLAKSHVLRRLRQASQDLRSDAS